MSVSERTQRKMLRRLFGDESSLHLQDDHAEELTTQPTLYVPKAAFNE